MINRKLGTGQANRTSYRKVNRVAVIRIDKCLTQRARATIVCIGDRDDVGRPVSLSRGSLCEPEWDQGDGQQ